MRNNSLITLPYESGNVSVVKGSRIKVYTLRGSFKGFLLDYDGSGITILEPRNYLDFDSLHSENITGKEGDPTHTTRRLCFLSGSYDFRD